MNLKQQLVILVFKKSFSVAAKSDKNLMTISNLGVCFGPTLLRPEEETMAAIMDIKFCNVVVEIMIENYDQVSMRKYFSVIMSVMNKWLTLCHQIFKTKPDPCDLTKSGGGARPPSPPAYQPPPQVFTGGGVPPPPSQTHRQSLYDGVRQVQSAGARSARGVSNPTSPTTAELWSGTKPNQNQTTVNARW